MGKSKEPIRLRQRKRPSGLINLYLDIYLNGKRSYENLKLYLVPEKTRADKEKNKETLKLADAVWAGITKYITFHSGRHTFAVLMLDLGADIYTVQKLLGHKEIHTTQIYAKVMDKKKQEAAMLIPPILPIEPGKD